MFHTRAPKSIVILALGSNEEYAVLSVIEFTSARRKMSIVHAPDHTIYLYCKGADTVIFERFSKDIEQYKETTLTRLEKFTLHYALHMFKFQRIFT